jgi:hypothetical protein
MFYTEIIPHLLLPPSFEHSHLYILILYAYATITELVNIIVSLYTCIREAIGLNLGLYAAYPEFFRLSPQSLQANSDEVPRLGHNSILTNIFQFIIHTSEYSTLSAPR